MPYISRDKIRGATPMRKDPLAFIAEGLVSKLPSLGIKARPAVLKVLHELLDGADEAARTTRMQMQMHLVKVADNLLSASVPEKKEERMLTTEDAAKMMKCSRPYVVMLIDRKKLAGAVVTEGGHRRVPESSVLAWLETRSNLQQEGADYKAAAQEAGMYGVPEDAYVIKEKSAGRKRRA